MEKNITISVALATYNGGKYIYDQLKSLGQQTVLPDQLVVSDDHSTDRTIDIVKEYASTVPFDVDIFIHNENQGYARNFGQAMARCTGDIVFLCDQDDIWFPEKLERTRSLFDQDDQLSLLITDAEIIDEGGTPQHLTVMQCHLASGEAMSQMKRGCCSAFRRELLDIVLPIPEGCRTHDEWLTVLATYFTGCRRELITLQYYRRHGANASDGSFSGSAMKGSMLKVKSRLLRGLDRTPYRYAPHHKNLHQQLLVRVGEMLAQPIRHPSIQVSKMESVAAELREKIAVNQRREEANSFTGIARVLAIGKLWVAGGYRPFSGAKSAVRDLLSHR